MEDEDSPNGGAEHRTEEPDVEGPDGEQSGTEAPVLRTRDHDEIREWAKARGATPATAPGTASGGLPGVLRFDFPNAGQGLVRVSWHEWLRAFDTQRLEFAYRTDDERFYQLMDASGRTL
jgi:hypothetical protein